MIHRRWMLAALAALLSIAPFAADEAVARDATRHRAAMNRLRSTLVSFNFEETSLEDALEYISRLSQVNLVVAPKLRKDIPAEDLVFTLKLNRVTAKQALDILLGYHDLGMVFRHGVMMVTTKADARGKPILRIYSIADLTFKLRDFPGPDITLRPSGLEFEEPEESDREDPFEDPEFISELIQNNVDPATWDSDGVSISANKKMLIIRQSVETHAKIARFLMLLRSYK